MFSLCPESFPLFAVCALFSPWFPSVASHLASHFLGSFPIGAISFPRPIFVVRVPTPWIESDRPVDSVRRISASEAQSLAEEARGELLKASKAQMDQAKEPQKGSRADGMGSDRN